MINADITSEVKSSWNSSTILAMKKYGSPRFFIDSRRLSAVMKSDKWPVPSVEEIFDVLTNSSILTYLDLFQAIRESKWMKLDSRRRISFISL